MAKKNKTVSIQEMTARTVGRACQVLEELMLALYGASMPERIEGGALGDELGKIAHKLDELQMEIETGGFELPTTLAEKPLRYVVFKPGKAPRHIGDQFLEGKARRKSKAARAGGR